MRHQPVDCPAVEPSQSARPEPEQVLPLAAGAGTLSIPVWYAYRLASPPRYKLLQHVISVTRQ